MTYLGRDGKQYILVTAGGTKLPDDRQHRRQNSDALIAFALSDQQAAGPSLGPNTSSKAPPSPTSPALTASQGTKADLPDGPAKATVIAVCTKCHGRDNFSGLRMSRTAWEAK
jgi:hypothetical protein